uniref:Uncharacterized protein n=1 Tax=Aplanochytrium stocchinoi TaxID=215587 RepID=A0A7S3PNT1_9STRA
MFRVINPRFIRLISPTPGKISKNANHVHLQASSCRNSMVSQRQSEVAALAKPGKCWTIVLNRVMLYSSSATTKNTGSEFCDDLYKSGISKIESSDFEEGFKLLLRASELGFAPAQVALGQLYLQEDRDDIKQQQEKTTLSMIDEAGKPTGGASSAEEVLAELKQSRKENLRRRNEKQRENKQKSRSTKWKSKEKKEKNENLINITRYQVNKITPKDGEPKLEKNEEAAIRWFSLAAKQGSTDAMVQLGNVLLHRVETEKRQFKNKDVRGKLKEALDWYEKAAAHDPPHPDALYNLGLLYYEGFHDSLEIDPARSFLLIKTAADVCNDPSALFFVGHIGLQGDEKIPKKIIPDDIKYAWNCVKSAADQGHIEAMTYIFKFLLEDRNAERVGVSEEEAEEFAVGYLEKVCINMCCTKWYKI